MASASSLPEQLICLIIRFTASVPDLPLSLRAPRVTATLSLKQLIRQNLPSEHAAARLRLIYAGKVLADAEPLSRSLRLPPPIPPPPRDDAYNENGPGTKSKGKQPLRATPAIEYGTTAEMPPEAKKYYIHCSLGDALSPSELASEATLAQNTEIALRSQHETSASRQRRNSGTTLDNRSGGSDTDNAQRRDSNTAAPQPQGFDRLLSSGFTPAEVASLRSHFQTNLSFTHTPDTMPTPSQMRVLEDRWLDSSANDPSSSLAGSADGGVTGDAGWGAGFAVEEGGLDDMLWGYMTGFFWPLGSLVWGFREEGVWTRRRQVAVVMGVLINAIFGFMRWSA